MKTTHSMSKEAVQSRSWRKRNPSAYSAILRRYRETHPWFNAYRRASSRCKTETHQTYRWYGGKGIKMLLTMADCKYLWFRDDAASMEHPSIDRKDTLRDYTLENCRFIEWKENILNGRKARKVR